MVTRSPVVHTDAVEFEIMKIGRGIASRFADQDANTIDFGQALNPRGELYTDANVGERLAVRNLLDEMRGGGQITGGPANFNPKDRQAFANQLDRWLTAKK